METDRFNPQSDRCLICGSTRLLKYKAHAFDTAPPSFVDIVECDECSFAWQFPVQRSPAQSVQFFEAAYADKGRTQPFYFNPDWKREIAQLQFEFLYSLPGNTHTLLEIGAGAGFFAELAAANGCYVTAVDPALAKKEMKDDPLLTKIKGSLEQIPVGELFDCIALWDVIEHAENPLQLISKARQHLKTGGWMIIETGNFKSGDRLLGGLSHWIYQLEHRWYFSPESVQQILSETGFTEFVLCDTVLRPSWNGNADHSDSSWNHLLQSLSKDQQNNSAPLPCPPSLPKGKRWDKSGLNIFTIAARKP